MKTSRTLLISMLLCTACKKDPPAAAAAPPAKVAPEAPAAPGAAAPGAAAPGTAAPAAADPTAAAPSAAAPAAAAPAAAAPAVAAGPEPSKEKEMLGLDIKPMGDWKTEWDADAHVAKWTRDATLTSIWITVESDTITNIDELKSAAPMNSHIGEAVDEVVETKATPRGFYAVVKHGGKSVTFVDVLKFGSTTLTCSAGITPGDSNGQAITQKEAFDACESIAVKP